MFTTHEKEVLKQALLKLKLYDNPYLIFEFAKFMDMFREKEPGVFIIHQREDERTITYTREQVMSMFYTHIKG